MINRNMFRGTHAVMTTSFLESGEIDLESNKRKVNYLIKESEVDGIVITGSIGECWALTDEKKANLWKLVKEKAEGKVPIIAGTVQPSTKAAIKTSKAAEKLKLDGVMNMPPYYWPLEDEAIIKHFQALDDALSIPIMVYNNENVSGVDMSPELISRLADIKNIKSIKEATSRLIKLEKVVKKAGNKISIMNGMSVIHEPYATMLGCPGMLDPFANFLGPTTTKIRSYADEGKYDKAFELKQKAVTPFSDYLFSFSSIPQIVAAYKYLEKKLGLISCDKVMLPAHEISEKQKKTLDKLLIETEEYRKL